MSRNINNDQKNDDLSNAKESTIKYIVTIKSDCECEEVNVSTVAQLRLVETYPLKFVL